MEDYKIGVGQRLQYLRKKRKLPVQSIIDRLDIARSTYTGWELGRRTPKGESLVILADIFGTTVDYITGKTDDESPVQTNVKEVLETKRITWDGKDITEDQAEAISRIIEAYLKG